MKKHFGEVLDIEDLGNHSAATVIRLGLLLSGPVDVIPDPKRKGFYDVEHGSTVYYIHVSPVSARVFLLAACERSVLQVQGSLLAQHNDAAQTSLLVERDLP